MHTHNVNSESGVGENDQKLAILVSLEFGGAVPPWCRTSIVSCVPETLAEIISSNQLRTTPERSVRIFAHEGLGPQAKYRIRELASEIHAQLLLTNEQRLPLQLAEFFRERSKKTSSAQPSAAASIKHDRKKIREFVITSTPQVVIAGGQLWEHAQVLARDSLVKLGFSVSAKAILGVLLFLRKQAKREQASGGS